MKNTITIAKQLALIFAVLLVVNSCQKDDAVTLESKITSQQNSTTKSVSASEIPKVMQFLESKCNNRLEFIIDDSNSELGMHRSHEENLSMTTALTDQIKMVTNNYGKSNYTFTLIEEQTKEGVYFLNLVVKEYKDELYMYIVKYVPDVSWLTTYKNETSLNNFSGAVYLYNEEGIYVGKVDMVNGMSSVFTKHPCDGDGGGEENDTDHVDNNSGGAGNSGDDTESSGESGSSSSGNSSSTGDGGGSGGWDIFVIFDCCGYQGQLVGVHDHVECTAEIVVNLSANTDVESGNVILGGRSLRDVLRHPCDEAPEECFDAVGDPCPNGCDEDGNCVDDSDEIENSGVGIDIDLGEVLFTSFINTLTEEQQQFLEDNPEIEDEIFLFLEENGFSDEAEAFVEDIVEEIYMPMDKKCQIKQIWDFTKNIDNSLVDFIRTTFVGNDNFNLSFEDIDLPDALDANANTSLPLNLDFNENTAAIISLDNSYLDNATDLSIVMSVTHEYVHVWLTYLYSQGELLSSYPSYGSLSEAFQDFEDNPSDVTGGILADEMHAVYDDFLDVIIDAVYNYAVDNNIPEVTESYCQKLVIGAHQETNTFQSLSSSEQNEYSIIAVNEEEGSENSKGNNCE